ncbi:MAG: hypothetical protein Q9195_000508 [Heterodermia aff. obscurata]
MTGRGSGKIFHPSPNPAVKIGLTVSLSPTNLTISPLTTHPSEPFHIVITARILSTPHPSLPITLCTHRNPLGGFSGNPTFKPIYRVSPPPTDPPTPTHEQKNISLFTGWAHYVIPLSDDLRDFMHFVTIPSVESGQSVSVQVGDLSGLV